MKTIYALLLSILSCSGALGFMESTPSGLVGRWMMDDGSGTTTVDASGNNNTGTFINTPVWTNGVVRSGLRFNGANSGVNIGSNATIFVSLPATLTLWIKLDVGYTSSTNDAWFNNNGMFSTSTYSGFDVIDSGTKKIEIDFGNVTGSNSRQSKVGTSTLTTNIWYFIAGTFTGRSNMVIYLNGVNDNGNYSNVNNPSAVSYRLAVNGGIGNIAAISAHYFLGSIDDCRIYSRALTQNEITKLYNGGHGSQH